MKKPPPNDEELMARARKLRLHGLLAHWEEFENRDWIPRLIEYEEIERKHRSLQRRISQSRVGRFKPMADFDWRWPKKIDRSVIEELFTYKFLDDAVNVVLVGPNGVGKSMIAQNLIYQSLLRGHTARFITASEMLNDLAEQDGIMGLQRRLRFYSQPHLLVVDEVGYLSYGNRQADLLFEIVTRRYQKKSIIMTTNKPFSEWNEVFPNSACVVALIDRLVHKAEIVQIEGASYRLKEAKERADKRLKRKRGGRKKK